MIKPVWHWSVCAPANGALHPTEGDPSLHATLSWKWEPRQGERALGSASLGAICLRQTNIYMNCILTAFHFGCWPGRYRSLDIELLSNRQTIRHVSKKSIQKKNLLWDAMWRHHPNRVTLAQNLPATCFNNMSISLILSNSPDFLYFTSYQQNKLIQIYVWYMFCQLIQRFL